MYLSIYLAFRYLKNKILLILPILGLTLGTATLIVVHSVMKGFAVDLERVIKGLPLDITIEHKYNDFFSYKNLARGLRDIQDIKTIIPSIEMVGILKISDVSKPVKIWAIPINDLTENWKQFFTPFTITKKPDSLYGYIGCYVTSNNALVNQKTKFFTLLPTNITLPIELNIKLVGSFCTDLYEYDEFYLVTDLHRFQKAIGIPKINKLYIELKNPARESVLPTLPSYSDLDRAYTKIKAILAKQYKGLRVTSWRGQKTSLLSAVEVERNITQLIITFILITTGFGFGSLLYVLVINKTKEIGYLKSLGTTNIQVFSIFLVIALIISISGSLFGSGLGYLFAKNINQIAQFLEKYIGFKLFPPQEYLFYSIPFYWSWSWINFITILNISLMVLAAVLPAYKAARLHPAYTLKNE